MKHMLLKNIVMLLVMISLLSTLVGCSQTSHQEQELESLKMASWSQPIVEQSNLFVAEEKGWFEEAGLDFEYVPGAGGGDAIKNIIAGNADIAFANVEAVLQAMEQGEKLKIIYNIYPENVFNLVSLKESNITSVEDLRGQDVGVYSLSSGTYDNLKVLLYSAGMTEEDINVVPAGVLNFGPLMNKQVVATAATDTGLYDALQQGLGEVNVIEVKDVLNTPTDVFVVTKEIFNQKRDLLVRFLQVYKDSVKYTLENPEEAAKIAADYAIDGQDEQRNLDIIKIRNETSINDEMKDKGPGWLDVEIFKQVEETYLNIGLLEKPVNVAEIVTNELVKELK
ncbi:NitT/TauT family transport system substrate-binding protein [Caldalkalibacillus uzonensis]|uniref:Thiamine pyrimidine synthase n=1 Tax=Caldalkalibacillus uzonensis TaxID=353224 RepID=A0ABU0CNG0_9BACI|nr:ABC transporter substrate-binding protein [Caldalkalibacillus uzonensis]MDQ0337429.1 NitT/TauT family transport system substrate-binding protein [Caldalkalibacillus uzonensis]